MRASLTAVIGATVTLGAVVLSRTMTGLPAAASFLFAATVLPVALGVALATATGDSKAYRRRLLRLAFWRSRDRRMIDETRCSLCGGVRRTSAAVLICDVCEQPLYSTIISGS